MSSRLSKSIMKTGSKTWSRLFVTFAALLLGASVVQAQSDPIMVLGSDEFYNSTALTDVTNSFEVVSDPNGKLVVTIGSETGASVASVTYGGVALSEAIDNNNEANRLAAVYYLDDPVAGTDDLVVTYSAASKSRIGAVSLGNAADGVSVTADAVAATTDSLSVDLTTIATDTLVIGAFSQNDQGNGTTVQPYPSDQRISHGDSGSSFTSSGYVQVPVASGPTTYTWTIASAESCDAVLAGFASAGEIVTDPISVLNSAEFYNSTALTDVTNSFEVVSDPNGKLVVTIGSETAATISGVTYGGVALSEAANTGPTRLVAVYYLDDPTAGTDDLVVTFSGTSKSRIGAVSLGNAADGVSVTADAVSATTNSLSVDLTTIKKDTLVIAAFTQNNQSNGTTNQPYSAGERISHGDSGSSFTSSGYVQVPDASGPTTYTWTIASAESCDAVLVGFASAGEIASDPISVLNSAEFYNSTYLTGVTNSFEVVSDPNGKLVVTIGSETGASVASVTYGGVALSEAIDNNNEANRLAAVYYLDDPVAGTDDLVVTYSAASKSRIGAVSLGNAADGVSVTADAVAATTDSLSVNLTTIRKDTLVIGAYTQNGSGLTAEPYSAGERISYGDSGSSFTSSGYVQVPDASGPTAYTWTISTAQLCDAVLAGFASAGEIASDPISVLNSDEFYNSTALADVTNSFEVVSDPNGKLVVTIGAETGSGVASVTYGGVALSEAIDNNNEANRLAAVYYLDDPVAGTDDLVVTFNDPTRTRIGAVSLGNAADGVSVTADVVAATTDSLSVNLTTIRKDTLVIGAFSQNNQSNGTVTQPYSADERISHGDSGSSFTSTGYVQVPEESGPTAYTWTIASAEICDAVLAGFASAGIASVLPPEPDLSEFNAPQALVTPVIDGSVTAAEWYDAFALEMAYPDIETLPNVGNVTGDTAEMDPADISGTFYYKWDADYLYFGFNITDDVHIAPDPAAGYPDDHILFGFDPSVANAVWDNTLTFEMFVDGTGTAQTKIYKDGVGTLSLASSVFSGSSDGANWSFEGKLKWTEITGDAGYVPANSDQFGTAIMICDNDADDGARDVFLASAGYDEGGVMTMPELWHTVTLSGSGSALPETTFSEWISEFSVGTATNQTDDFDSDGMNHLVEYALGANPEVDDAASYLPVSAVDTGANLFSYVYNRRITAANVGLTYTVQADTNLLANTWSTNGVSETAEVINSEFEEVTATTAVDADSKFLRLQIEQAE